MSSAIPTDPATIVIFGGSGDLSKRKLVPALFELHREKQLPPATAIVGYARTGESDETYRAEMKAAVAEFARKKPVEEAEWTSFRLPALLLPGRPDDSEELRRPQGAPRDDREGAGPAGQPALLSRDPALLDRRRREQPRPGGLRLPGRRRPVVARHRGKAVRARSRDGPRAERGAGPGLPRAADLPHRPLPRQGDDAEHPRPEARKRHLRAAVEPPLRRPRADHGGRVHRRREPREVLRGGRRPPRHHPESRSPAPVSRRDGAARRLRPERRARREGEGAEVHPAAVARGDPARQRARTVRTGRGGRADGRGLSRRRRTSTRCRSARRTRRGRCRSRTGGGRACRSTCAPENGSPSASRRSRSSSRRRRSLFSARSASSGRSRTSSSCASSPTRASR